MWTPVQWFTIFGEPVLVNSFGLYSIVQLKKKCKKDGNLSLLWSELINCKTSLVDKQPTRDGWCKVFSYIEKKKFKPSPVNHKNKSWVCLFMCKGIFGKNTIGI